MENVRVGDYVTVRLTSVATRAKGFYILMTSGTTSSLNKYEFCVPRKSVDKLKENKIDYQLIA